ncbi:hypothetical protein N7490_006206 [Penicillium lividum]|nr:hypothetical protein N7490_006206 [Penicillium lividum]
MNGNKRSNSVPESEKPSAKKAALGPSADHSTDFDSSVDPSADSADPTVGPPMKWTFTKMADIPLPIRSENVSKFSIEFLHQGMLGENLDIPANHCVARLTFQNEQEYDTDYAAAGTKGILIDLHFDPNAYNSGSIRGPSHVGQLHIKPFKYVGKHRNAAYDFDVPMKRTNGITFQVKDFLRVIQSNDLMPVSFNLMEDDAVACKDFK